MNIIKILLILIQLVILCVSISARPGDWLNDKEIIQLEARDGSYISVVLNDTNGVCNSNRVEFRDGKWINQNGVNHYYSLLLTATSISKPISIHIELESGTCYGRIGFIRAN
jgi:hypothetical protein